MKKRITVLTNDPGNPKFYLTISGIVEQFARILPKRVSLIGDKGQDLNETVKIIPEKKYPFTIVHIRKSESSNFDVTLQKMESSDSGYTLFVKNLKKEKGYYNEQIELLTDSTVKPKLTIHVNGLIQ